MIYDDTCLSCQKFAKIANVISRGWIRIGGHYYSEEAIRTKTAVFPKNYESTKMFWIINSNGAFGGRAGLMPLIKEVLVGLFIHGEHRHERREFNPIHAEISKDKCVNKTSSCESIKGTIDRVITLLKSSAKLPVHK
jgi:hypothetical protein